jgi:hypothetical protein
MVRAAMAFGSLSWGLIDAFLIAPEAEAGIVKPRHGDWPPSYPTQR